MRPAAPAAFVVSPSSAGKRDKHGLAAPDAFEVSLATVLEAEGSSTEARCEGLGDEPLGLHEIAAEEM